MNRTALILLLSMAIIIIPCSTSTVDAALDIEYFQLRLVDNEGNNTGNVLAESYTVDTFSPNLETTLYYLKAHKTISASSVNLLIDSSTGEYNAYVSMENLTSYLAESGIRVEIEFDTKVYHADLKAINQYTAYFKDEYGATAALEPGIMYPMTIRPLEDVSSTIVPESINEVRIEFTAHLKSGYHQVAFYSNGVVIEAYQLADGGVISTLPVPEKRDGYIFQGWYLPNGTELTEGYVVTPADGDIVATAKWTSENNDTVSF